MTTDLGKTQLATLLSALDEAPRNPANRDAALRALGRSAEQHGLTMDAVIATAPDLLEGRLDAATWRARLTGSEPVPVAEVTVAEDEAAAPGGPDPVDAAALAAENETLRARIAELEQLLATRPARPAREPRAAVSREGTKQARVIAMLRRPEGATLAQIVEATGWLPHTARAMISAAIGKKLGLPVTSSRDEAGNRVYRITGP